MASGVGVSSQCLDDYQELKLGKKSKYIIYSLNDSLTEIVTLKKETSTDWEQFLKDLPEDQCRWAVYDFEFEKEGGGLRNKLLFISWSPDNAKIKQKMVFAASRDALRRSLVGIAAEIQATDVDEITRETVLEKVNKGY
ncbi:hypothetical protein AX16_008026 [Volvariella volvacea WC 439]|nr:hypothetical protein AX16_008026 [Volvariella volvacea WC 439]